MYKTWTADEKIFIEQNALKLTDTQLHEELSKRGGSHSLASVRKYRQRLSLKKLPGRPKNPTSVSDINKLFSQILDGTAPTPCEIVWGMPTEETNKIKEGEE